MRRLLRRFGDPHRRFRSIHIAGTNGKGSTAALLASVLTESGYRTALYTSPHLVDVRERMKIDGRPIPRNDFVRILARVYPEIVRREMTFFEAVTAVAFVWFAEQEVDVAVIETGLGGRLDATNVIRPVLSVITSVGLEHTAILGPTIARIAREKAGIIKPGVPVVSGVTSNPAVRVINSTARRRGVPVYQSSGVKVKVRSRSLEGTRADLWSSNRRLSGLWIGLAGGFQIHNARTMLAAVDALTMSGRVQIPDESIRRGLAHVRMQTGFQGRLSTVRRSPVVIVDVAHNPDAMKHLAASVHSLVKGRVTVIIGVASDKDLSSIARWLTPVAGKVIAVAAKSHRSRKASEIAAAFSERGIPASTGESVGRTVLAAVRRAHRKETLLITGSHFVVGEALAALERRRYLTISQ